jgi:thiamine pyrophosphokinase
LIIGDLDSADPKEVNRFRSQGVEVRRFPAHKDETDLELALEAILEMGVSTIWIAAALGNRIDQTLGNIFLLAQTQLSSLDIRLLDGRREVFLIRDHVTINGLPGQTVSLLPLLGPVKGVTTSQLAYPLNHEILYPYHTRGISNEMLSERGSVSIKEGVLLCIHTLNEVPEKKG